MPKAAATILTAAAVFRAIVNVFPSSGRSIVSEKRLPYIEAAMHLAVLSGE